MQSSFTASLLDPRRPVPDGVTSHNHPHPLRRFNVYRNNVVASLVDVLHAYFPVVVRLVGDEFFRAMAREYVTCDLPRSPILSRYGAGFADFIQGFAPVADLPYLADVARLEWLRRRAYHAADQAPPGLEEISAIADPAAARLRLHPSAGWLASAYPIVSIWATNTHDDEVRPIDLENAGEVALVLRPRLDVIVMRLPPGGCAFLSMLSEGRPLGEASRAAYGEVPEFDFATCFAILVDAGALAIFDTCRPIDPETGETA